MQENVKGACEDLISRCGTCEYCIFEYILRTEQRKNKVLDLKIPKKHVHRSTIEQICGSDYDEVCHMKYAAMRAFCDDRTAMQMGVVKNFAWDLGKKHKKEFTLNQAMLHWTKKQELGRKKTESYAKRFDEVWKKGLRTLKINGITRKRQILTIDHIYEIVMAKPQTYENALGLLDLLITEHRERDAI